MSRRIATISAALVLALLGTLLVVVYIGRADARALDGVQAVNVLVARSPVAKGLSVKAAKDGGLLELQALPRKTVPADAIVTMNGADDSLTFASDVTPGEILRTPRLVPAAAAAPTTLQIPPGKLAVTVQLEDPARVASFVTVGAKIAVFDSYNVFEGSQGGSWTPSGDRLSDKFENNKATRVLLPSVQVIAIGATFNKQVPKPSTDGKDKAAVTEDKTLSLVTVAVSQREAEKLVHGTQIGSLYLGLLGDDGVVKTGPGVDNRTLFNP